MIIPLLSLFSSVNSFINSTYTGITLGLFAMQCIKPSEALSSAASKLKDRTFLRMQRHKNLLPPIQCLHSNPCSRPISHMANLPNSIPHRLNLVDPKSRSSGTDRFVGFGYGVGVPQDRGPPGQPTGQEIPNGQVCIHQDPQTFDTDPPLYPQSLRICCRGSAQREATKDEIPLV